MTAGASRPAVKVSRRMVGLCSPCGDFLQILEIIGRLKFIFS